MNVDVVLTSDSQDRIDSATVECRLCSWWSLPLDSGWNDISSKGSSSDAVDLRSMFLRIKWLRFVSLLRVDLTGQLSSLLRFSQISKWFSAEGEGDNGCW